jgi:hypothetical protein
MWQHVMEMAFATALFHREMNVRFLLQVVLLMYHKSFHWISEERVSLVLRSLSCQPVELPPFIRLLTCDMRTDGADSEAQFPESDTALLCAGLAGRV